MSTPEQSGGSVEMRGVAVGIVADNDDPEDMGRVKLRFPWRGVDDESYWARIAVPMAGKDMGTYFLPERGDEVLVAFDDGDIRHPYVVGALWNGEQTPPEKNDGNNDVRKVKSRSGHEVVLDDADGEEAVEVKSQAGHRIALDDKSGSEKVTVEDKSGSNKIEFDATKGSLSIEGSSKISVEAPQIEIKSDGNATVEAGGMLTLKGAVIKLN